MIKKNRFQLFTEGEGDPAGTDPAGTPTPNNEPTAPKTFTQEEVDALLAAQKKELGDIFDKKFDKKFADYKAKSEQEKEEAAKLASMNAQEKAEHERDQYQKELEELRSKVTRSEMTAEARKMLSEQNISVEDDLIGMLIGADAENTQKAVNAFAEMFKTELEKAIKAKLAGQPPKAGGTHTITKEEILAVKDPIKRQELMAANFDLFERK